MRQARGYGDGSIYRTMESRKDGPVERWVAQIYVDGHKRRVVTDTEAKARRELRKLMRSVDDGAPVSDGNLTLSTLIREWDTKVLSTRNLAPSTVGRHRWALDILRADLGGVKVRSLTPDRVERAFAARAEAGLARASIIKIRGTLSQVLKWAVRRDLVARNIATVIELPSTARAAKEGRSLTPAQARMFLEAAAGTPLEAMWTAMLYLGLRPGEAAGISWPDFDFDAKTIHIWRSMSRTATGAAVLADTKTPQSVRSLDVPKPVLDAFRRRRTDQQEQRLAAGSIWRNEHDLVFTSPTGHPIDAAACRRELNAIGRRAGIGVWRPNELRHSAASLMSDAGVPIEQVADQLGHKDLRMLQKHYRHRIRPTVGAGLVLEETLHMP